MPRSISKRLEIHEDLLGLVVAFEMPKYPRLNQLWLGTMRSEAYASFNGLEGGIKFSELFIEHRQLAQDWRWKLIETS